MTNLQKHRRMLRQLLPATNKVSQSNSTSKSIKQIRDNNKNRIRISFQTACHSYPQLQRLRLKQIIEKQLSMVIKVATI